MRRESVDPGSFWLDRRGRRVVAPRAREDAAVDVVVVGAGIAGACAAARLAEAGCSVALVDGHEPGRGATGRNAGFLLAEGAETTAEVSRTHGRATAEALRDAGLATREVVETVARRRDIGFARTGSLRLAEDDGEAANLEATARMVGVPVRYLDASALPIPYHGRGYVAALVDPGDGVVDPLALLDAMLDRARAGRLTERYGEAVTGLVEESDGVVARCGTGAIRARHAIVGVNAWTNDVLGAVPAVRPVRAQMLAARVTPLPSWHVPTYARRGADYWRLVASTALLGGRRFVGGATEETDDARPADPVQPALDAFLRRLAGPAARIDVVTRWAGTMGFTPDGMPAVGRAPGRERTYVLGGWNGHGIGWGPGLAVRLADVVLGRGSALSSCFDPARAALSAEPPAIRERPAAG